MIKIYPQPSDIHPIAADLFVAAAKKAIAEKGSFTVALTGGSSPVELYKLLATPTYIDQLDWTKVFVFWGDERWVPLSDSLSNAKMAFETLLHQVPLPEDHIFPMYDIDRSPKEFAAIYEQQLRDVLGAEGQFDLILLGMGDDGHTASLFPHTEVLQEKTKWVDAYYLTPQQMHRITLTAPLINKAKQIIVITFGEKKAPALREVLEGARNPEEYPSQLLSPTAGDVLFLVDQAAASRLSSSVTSQ
ncbi:6-phosphogluconolactonase [Sphingobacterium sp. lm-10]|uniref:6-phosphogluconolactonase n=1 Tax=Sphingobacterium sp. lm-10 TaxID=2944904 RepID=UPI002022968D|nr:6-phosphogluconolactonase [Sphingobacterium sp. lm-10]